MYKVYIDNGDNDQHMLKKRGGIVLDSNDLKALNFREDLIKLLKEYDCEMFGSCMDDGNMNLEFNFDFGNYIMQDSYNNYNIIKENDEKCENIIDNYILNCFPRRNGTMAGLNNVKVHTFIFTSDSNKAQNKIVEIINKTKVGNIQRFINSRNIKELILTNGDRYVWHELDDIIRGYRCSHAIIDRTMTLEQLYNWVLPICIYCNKDTVEMF